MVAGLLVLSLILPPTLLNPGILPLVFAQQESAQAYPPDPPADVPWSDGFGGVADIEQAYSYARQQDGALPPLTLPAQEVWDQLNNEEKALWLINQERIVRNIPPLGGVHSGATSVAQEYAAYLLANNAFSHTADGRTPAERLNTVVAIRECSTMILENLSLSLATMPIALPVERAIYAWLYDNSSSNWGHRHNVLRSDYVDDGGAKGQEGFIGVGKASGSMTYAGDEWAVGEIVVFTAFDPCAAWDYTTTGNETPVPTGPYFYYLPQLMAYLRTFNLSG